MHTYMRKRTALPPVAELIKHWMTDASEADQIEATENLRRYLAVMYRIFLRLEAEGKLPPLKKDAGPDTEPTSLP